MVLSPPQMEGEKWFSGHSHLRIYQKDGLLTNPSPISPSPPSPFTADLHREGNPSPSSKISPAVLFIIVILAVLFFISGLLHLLVRFLTKRHLFAESSRNLTSSSSDALQRQLQQLFHLHDSGLDQAFIDALPVFSYKEIVGPKEPFDCAVCLCEFTEIDQLRLLPMCSHAFHINCIDTWLLSNSSCPLCRSTLIDSTENPIFHFDDFKEEDGPVNGENRILTTMKRMEIDEIVKKKGVFPVKLGKFQKMEACLEEEMGAESSSSKFDGRRCYSMGSYQYLVGDVDLTVSLNQETRRSHAMKGANMNGQANNTANEEITETKKISIGSKTDSFSISKIWLWPKKEKFGGSADVQFHDSLPITDSLQKP